MTTVNEPGRETAQDLVRISHHMFYLLDDGCFPQLFLSPLNGLVAVESGAAMIFVGASGGVVRVCVEARRTPPTRVNANGWEEIVEVSMEATAGRVAVAAVMDNPPDLPSLTISGPGPYRVRVHARGRDAAPDLVATQPLEDYYIVMWPYPLAPELVHRQTDRYGAGLRRSARGAPT